MRGARLAGGVVIAVLLAAGCTPGADPLVTEPGNPALELITGEPADTGAAIGSATLTSGVAVFDAPDGAPVGRLEPGVHPLLRVEGTWAQVVLPGSATGWVTTNDDVTLRLG